MLRILRSIAAAFLATFFFPIVALAAPVSHLSAMQVAQNFMRSHVTLHGAWNGVTDPRIGSMELISHEGEALLYNVRVEPSGFMLLAYDDDFSPVLMYSDTSSFDAGQISDPNSVAAWIIPETHAVLQGIRHRAAEMDPAAVALAKAQAPSTRAWAHFDRSPRDFAPLPMASKADGPADVEKLFKAGNLLASEWGQGDPTRSPYTYNFYTPARSGSTACSHALTGCVATALAQILRFHGWPDSGVGSHSYSLGGTTLSANFAHPYNWSSMPDALSHTSTPTQVDAVAKLMSDLGIAVEMNYGCGESGANPRNLAILPTYFKYRNTIQIVDRAHSSTAGAFFDVIRREIDAGRPIFMAVYNTSGGGHAVVADGYQLGSTNMAHINLGWQHGFNLYYDISNNWTTSSMTWIASSQILWTNIQPDRPTSCAYALSGSTLSTGAGAGSGSVNISTASACAWTATSNAGFISVTSGASGSGNGTVGFSIAANSGAARSGTLTIGGQTFTVNQAAPACSYAISQSSQSISASSSSGNIGVTAGGACAWTAYSNANWITITSGASGTGNGSVVYSVDANGTLSARAGTIVAAGQTFTINQAAATCSFGLSASTASVAFGATTGNVSVSALPGCSWSAQSNASWLTITAAGSGNGIGTVSYSVAANTTSSSRTGTITIGGQSLTVTQAGLNTAAVELVNGDFENGRSGWTEQSNYVLIYQNFLYAYQGSWYAWLAGVDNADDTLHQRVTIPANATQVTLDFWYGITTDELQTGAYDKMFVNVYNSTGAFVATLGSFSNLDADPYWRNKTYDLSAYKGQTIYVGFHATSDSSLDTNFYLDNVKLTVSAADAGNTPGALSGLWYNAAESGWGVYFTQRRNILFAAWYAYDGAGNPKWYVSTCNMPTGTTGTSGTCNGAMYEESGPAFFGVPFNSQAAVPLQNGNLQVTFQDADHASMTYTGVAGQTRTVAIVRQPLAAGTTPPPINYTDMWWVGPTESGWGMAITQQFSTVFLAWYVYDSQGKPTWYVTTCTLNGTTCTGDVLRTTGPAFGPTFNSSQVRVFTAGTITVNFTDANNATLNYTVNGVGGSKTITRQLF